MKLDRVIIAVLMLIGLALSLACGGGGGAGSGASAGTLLKARFAPGEIYPGALPGDTLVIYKLGQTTPSFKAENLADVTAQLTVSFEPGSNYIFTVERLGVNFLGTIITSAQIDAAVASGALSIGELNSVTTFLAHEIDPKTWDKNAASGTNAITETIKKYSEAKNFSELTTAKMLNGSAVMTPLFRNEVASRANAMYAYAMILKEAASRVPAVTLAQKNALNSLHVAILTGNSNTWLEASRAVQAEISSFSGVDFSSLQLFSAVGSEYVLNATDLKNIFFSPELANQMYIYDLAVETPHSVISGTVSGAGAEGTVVYLQRKVKGSNDQYITQQVTTGADGSFAFNGLAADNYQLVPQKEGVFYKSSAPSLSGNTISLSITSFELANYVDNTTISMTSGTNLLQVKDGGVTEAKLESTLAAKINAAASIDASELATNAVTSTKILDGSVSASKLATDAVTNVKMANDSVNTAELVDGAVTSTKIFDGSVSASKLATDAVTNVKMANDSVNTAELVDGAVTSAKLSAAVAAALTAAASIDSSEIADGNVMTVDLADSSVTTAKIANGSVTSSKLDTNINVAGNLVVAGSANLSGLVYPSAIGSTGHVLKVGAGGNLVFGAIAGGYNPATDAITGGTINGVVVGGTAPAAATFTTVNALTSANVGAGGLTVNGGATVGSTLAVTGAATVGGALGVTGSTTVGGNLAVTGATTVGTLTGTTANLANVNVSTLSNVSGNLVVAGSANLSGIVYPSAIGSTGHVLKVDAGGNLVFGAVAGGYNPATDAITGGTINGVIIGGTTPAAATFTTLNAQTSANVGAGGLTVTGSTNVGTLVGTTATLNNVTITNSANILGMDFPARSTGSTGNVLKLNAQGNLYFGNDDSGAGGGSYNAAAVAITGGNVNGVAIGGTTPSTAAFTTLNASTSANVGAGGLTVNGTTTVGALTGITATLSNVTITNSANILGMVLPAGSTGTAGNVLKLNAQGNLYFGNDDSGAGGGAYNAAAVAITGGNVDGVAIGATTPSTAAFSTINALTSANVGSGGLSVNGGATVGGTLGVTGASTLSTLSGTTATFATLDAQTSANVGTGGLTVRGTLGVTGASTVAALTGAAATFTTVDAQTSANVGGALTVAGTTTSNIVDAQTSANVGGALTVAGTTTTNILDAQTSANVGGPLTVVSSANVGGALTVVGSANITGFLFPVVDGSANTFLTTNGSGNLIFSSANQLLGSSSISSLNLTGATLSTVSVTSGAIDNTTIGATAASSGNFTTLNASSLAVASNVTVSRDLSVTEDLTVTGNTYLGSTSSTLVRGNAAGGNVWFAGNLISSANTYSLGTATSPWSSIYAIDLVTTSDERLKKDIEPLDYGLDAVMKLRPVSYNWKNIENHGRTIGLLAQEVEEVVSEAVSVGGDEQHTRGVRYYNMVPILIRAIQDQQAVIDAQKKSLEAQTQRLERLESAILTK